jgi:phage-related minor tail protein
MSGHSTQDAHGFGSDSFLDVVTNMVGILIVLVMVVGVRIKHAPATSSAAAAPSVPSDEIQRLESEAEALEQNVVSIENQIAHVGATTQARYEERGTLAMLAEERERELANARQSLDQRKQKAFDLGRAKSAAEAELANIENRLREAADAEKRKKRSVQIKNYPTPLSQTVLGEEAHFQLLGGRLTWVPLKDLQDMCIRDIRARVQRLRDVSEISDTVGPIDGFRATYTIQREELSPEEQMLVGNHGSVAINIDLVPARDDLGETLEEAFGRRSQFRARLASLSQRRTTVTLWIYPDSFGAYASIKEQLYKLGFTVAARPMPAGLPISASNHGSHSQAQ